VAAALTYACVINCVSAFFVVLFFVSTISVCCGSRLAKEVDCERDDCLEMLETPADTNKATALKPGCVVPLGSTVCKLGSGTEGGARVCEVPPVNFQVENKGSTASLSAGSLLGGGTISTGHDEAYPVCEEIEIAGGASEDGTMTDTDTCGGGSSFVLGPNYLTPVLELHEHVGMHGYGSIGHRIRHVTGAAPGDYTLHGAV
jgi:hypothetical protein